MRGYPRAHPGGLGEHNARDTLSPLPAACPTRRRTAVPAPSHRLRSARNATRRPGAAGRCWSVVLGHHVWRRPSVKDARELHRLRMRQELRRHPRHSGTSLLGPTSDRRDAPPSMEHVCHRNGAAASPKAARTARRAPEAGAPRRERALLVSFARGLNTGYLQNTARRGRQRLGGVPRTMGSRHGPCGHADPARRAPRARRRA